MYWPLGALYISSLGLTLATPSGLAGKQSRRRVRETGRSEEVDEHISLLTLQNRLQESWNEVNSMPTDRPDFGVICGQIRPKGHTGHAEGHLSDPDTSFLCLCCGYSFSFTAWKQCPVFDNSP